MSQKSDNGLAGSSSQLLTWSSEPFSKSLLAGVGLSPSARPGFSHSLLQGSLHGQFIHNSLLPQGQ